MVERIREQVAPGGLAPQVAGGNRQGGAIAANMFLPDYCDFIRYDEQRTHQRWVQDHNRAHPNQDLIDRFAPNRGDDAAPQENQQEDEAPLVQEEALWYEALFANFSILYVLRVIYVVFVHFILSLHNGWIDPQLRYYEQIRNARANIRQEQLNQMRE